MRIAEFSITRYGPLPSTGRTTLDDFSLLFGGNEYGKSLTIDALVRLLVGRKTRDFERIDRVQEKPEGYLVLEDEEGNQTKLPEKGSLTEVMNLTPSECRNIFVIRDSDLSVANEGDFYTSVTDRLVGLRTEDLCKIGESLRKLGRTTPTGMFMDIRGEKLKTRMDTARETIGTIEALLEEMAEHNVDEIEIELANEREELDRIEQQIAALDDARRRETYEKAAEALRRLEEAQSSEDDEITQQTQDVEKLKDKKAAIDETLRPMIANYRTRKVRAVGHKPLLGYIGSAAIAASLLFGLSLLGSIIAPSWLSPYLLVSLFGLLVFSWGFKYQFVRHESRIAEELARIRLEAAQFDLVAESAEGILSKISTFEEECSDESKKLSKMREKREASIAAQKGILESLFGHKGETLEENVSHWTERAAGLQEYKDKAKCIQHDEATSLGLSGQKKVLEDRLREMKLRMACFQKEMKSLEQVANQALRLEEDYLPCDTSTDLRALRDYLRQFLQDNERNREISLAAIEIFEELEAEERAKVSELFGKDSPTTEHFKNITDSLYEEVLFSQETGQIEVRRRDGVVLGADKLSGGAYDQLYLSIRLALGSKLLESTKGFFIMDDPFVKADPQRLERQLHTLRKIARLGWQVIYFTAKREVVEALQDDIAEGAVKYLEIPRMFP